MGLCELHKVSLGRCRRVATTTRKTSSNKLVHLCEKCDNVYGERIGEIDYPGKSLGALLGDAEIVSRIMSETRPKEVVAQAERIEKADQLLALAIGDVWDAYANAGNNMEKVILFDAVNQLAVTRNLLKKILLVF